MNDDELKALFQRAESDQREPDLNENAEVSEDAKRQAIAMAMAEFDAQRGGVVYKFKTFFQGIDQWLRPIKTSTKEGRPMKKITQPWIYGSASLALATVFSVTLFLSEGNQIPAKPEFGSSSSDQTQFISDEVLKQSKAREAATGHRLQIISDEEYQNSVDYDAPIAAKVAPKIAPEPIQLESSLGDRSRVAKGVGLLSRPHPEDYVFKPQISERARENFEHVDTNTTKLVRERPVSTFSIDVDTASYSFVRRELNAGRLPSKDSVRIEEMINYFDYHYPLPASRSVPFEASINVLPSPWKQGNKLVHFGIQAFDIEASKKPRTNLVFLLDVSGSMNSPDKLPLVKQSMELLLNQLDADDTVAVAVYAGSAGTVLEPTKVKDKTKILLALNRLDAGGSTAGAEGIELAYQLAEQNFDKNSINRIFLATDGDFNVGISDINKLKAYVERKRNNGIYLSVLGFGRGNYNDHVMQTLAQNGNGVAAYIDTLSEAQKVLVDEASASLFTVAKDVKLQVEFNPDTVSEYRLIGYETRTLKREDFNNDKVDSGDIGVGHSVTAIYEITPTTSDSALVEKLRYEKNIRQQQSSSEEYGFLKIRYKLPGQSKSKLLEQAIPSVDTLAEQNVSINQDVLFSTAVAGFAQLLKDDKYLDEWSYDDALELALKNRGEDNFGYRSEFVQLVRKAKIAKKL